MEDGGHPPVTNGDFVAMSTQALERLAARMPSNPRPSLASYQSNSLPSTPSIHARKLSDDARIPPPITKGAEVTSPRAARSESDTGLRPSGRTPFLTGCKYETGMAFSRRRIPYSLGGDKLERASSMPKKFLEPSEELELTSDMQDLYNQILPSGESEDRRTRFTQKLEKILNDQWPGNDIKVHVFGSSGNLLCTSDSDVDICITTPMRALERVCLLAKALADHGMERVVCVPHAKVPIVKIWDPELKLACDMNVNNTLALENTRMIKTYVRIDERVRPLAMVIKHWTQKRILNDAALGGTLSSYTWICMIISFLQTRNPPILPCLHHRPHQRRVDAEGKLSSFADDLTSLRDFGHANKETIGELLFHFFRRYAHEIDFDKYVISIREGGLISKQGKKWHLMQNNRLCVEEPFNTERNLGNTADDISFRGVHLELRRAFDLLSQVKLRECCEEYIFPAVEEKIWSKPVPQPRPVLSRSLSQQGRAARGGAQGRGGPVTTRHRSGTANRRASSAAASNSIPLKMNIQPHSQSNGHSPSNDRASGGQIHEQLIQQMNYLQAQEAQLRLQMHQRAQANIHAQLTAQIQPVQIQGPMFPHQLNLDNLARQRHMFPPGPMSAPIRKDPPTPATPFPNQQAQMNGYPTPPDVRTNPPSPSMTPARPSQPTIPEFRRSLHRSTTTDNNFVTLRSHSQPASDMRVHSQSTRPLPSISYQSQQQGNMLGYPSTHQYQQAYLRKQQMADVQQANNQAMMNSRLNSMFLDRRGEEVVPHHQYVGYYVDQSPSSISRERYGHMPSIPAYHDFPRGISPSVTRLRSHSSRSPSPSSLGSRDRSISFYSAASAPPSSPASRVSGPGIPSRHSGPIIIDGSSETSGEYLTPSESGSILYPGTMSEAALFLDDQVITPSTPLAATPVQEPSDLFNLDEASTYKANQAVPHILQFGDFPARSTRRASPNAALAPRQSMDILALSSQNDNDNRVFSNGLGIEFENPPAKAGGVKLSVSPPSLATSSKGISKLDQTSSPVNTDYSTIPMPLPLLSPVREVRTPSPTATRTSATDSHPKSLHSRSFPINSAKEATNSPLSVMTNGKERVSPKEAVEKMVSGANGSHTAGVASSSSSTPKNPPIEIKAQQTSWQQTIKKGKKAKGKSISSITEVTQGERKGG